MSFIELSYPFSSTARDQIASEQGRLLLTGIVKGDVDQAINDYIAKHKSVCADKVLAEVQKQVDEFPRVRSNLKFCLARNFAAYFAKFIYFCFLMCECTS
jgi:hypothetical protein